MHYEGIPNVTANYPCFLEIGEENLIISFNTGARVSLSTDRIVSFDVLGENEYFAKYKGANMTQKKKIPVSYLVINYISKENESKQIVLWAANHREIMFFNDIKFNYLKPQGNIEL